MTAKLFRVFSMTYGNYLFLRFQDLACDWSEQNAPSPRETWTRFYDLKYRIENDSDSKMLFLIQEVRVVFN